MTQIFSLTHLLDLYDKGCFFVCSLIPCAFDLCCEYRKEMKSDGISYSSV